MSNIHDNEDKRTGTGVLDSQHNGIPEVTNQRMKSALKKRYRRKESSRHVYGDSMDYFDDSSIDSSPLLSSTPPNVSKALIKLYPYLIVADKALSLFTWTNDEHWPNYLVIVFFIITTIYFDFIVKYFGQLIIIGLLWLYSMMDNSVTKTVSAYPTLDDIVHMMGRVSKKADIILAPVRVLSLQDIKRLFFTITFFLPLYVIISLFIITPKKLFLLGGIYTLTYHSAFCVLIRRALWNIRIVRLFSFYVTGLDLGGINKHQGIFITVSEQMKNSNFGNKGKGKGSTIGDKAKAIRFTYALYENQRRWLGIGWTSTMLSYERAAWTDAYLNPAPPLTHFKLPDDDSDMKWQWVDENWSLDMANDGAIQLSRSQPKLVSSPGSNSGYIYSDNTWTNPSTDDTYAKYTRRRRWIRTAELVNTSLLDVSGSKILEYDDGDDNKENYSENDSTRSISGTKKSVHLSVSSNNEDEDNDNSRGRSVSFSNVQNVRIIPANDSSFEETETESEDDSHQHCRNKGIDSLRYL
ncbi:similar to Saccharomyces cerevisiae YGR004W PEX31 Peroxisomal integral membrane protein, involved in negative regulation of peroxisome size [Maudiozyma saulgeensis]|uniref:Similar to Saccharomyces cerevisiae YGR004W PEX31 Peroxisomal integral membrane protein, involved in negative regulation of peroxisome size n=1 Tax=Maudiozyma saulgeensis TaxID=1789683 RepID=A0A1X7RBE4_9SACH|nr:similar to Saccharomyces cerevisiae YGR004W PEX31 Peroxisomal integral membrane protein, involved in negative regulation of peroxisome size [Kazachstania saulgeensis]